MSLFYLEHPAETDLALFAGGELGPLARWRIEKHLGGCERCRETVSDFFHLQGELAELAEVPSLDWDGLAQSISERAAREAPERTRPPQGFLSRPTVLRAGFATATVFCAFVVVRQLQLENTAQPDLKPLRSERSLSVAQNEVGADKDAAESDDAVASEPAERLGSQLEGAPPPRESERDLRAVPTPAEAGEPSRRKSEVVGGTVALGRGKALPGDSPRPSAPSDLRKAPLVNAPRTLAFASEAEALRSRVRGAPPASPATAPEAREEQLEAGVRPVAVPASAGREGNQPAGGVYEQVVRDRVDEVRPTAERAAEAGNRRANILLDEGGGRPSQAQTQVAAAARREAEGPRQEAQMAKEAVQPKFAIQPVALEDPQVDVGVAADGWMSVRSVDSKTGNITITHVYVP